MQAGWNGLRGTVRRLLWAMGGMLLLGLSQAWAGVSVTLTAPPNGSTYTAPANITLTATARTTRGYTVSKVEFFRSGATLIGADITAPYSFNWNSVPAGTYTITAVATAVKKKNPNQTATSAPVNITVNAPNVPPTVSMTSPANNATFTAPANITLTATAADSDGTIANLHVDSESHRQSERNHDVQSGQRHSRRGGGEPLLHPPRSSEHPAGHH